MGTISKGLIMQAAKKQRKLIAHVPYITHYNHDPERCFTDCGHSTALIQKTLNLNPPQIFSDLEANAVTLDMIERYPISAEAAKFGRDEYSCRLDRRRDAYRWWPIDGVRFFDEDILYITKDPIPELAQEKYASLCMLGAMRLIKTKKFINHHAEEGLYMEYTCGSIIRKRIPLITDNTLKNADVCPVCRENAIIQFSHNLWYYILCLPRKEESARVGLLPEGHAFAAYCLAICNYAIRRCTDDWKLLGKMAQP
jgi:hypothetical protein